MTQCINPRKLAVQMYIEGEISLEEALHIAGMDEEEFVNLLKEYGYWD